jgi:hypothetical protein
MNAQFELLSVPREHVILYPPNKGEFTYHIKFIWKQSWRVSAEISFTIELIANWCKQHLKNKWAIRDSLTHNYDYICLESLDDLTLFTLKWSNYEG